MRTNSGTPRAHGAFAAKVGRGGGQRGWSGGHWLRSLEVIMCESVCVDRYGNGSITHNKGV